MGKLIIAGNPYAIDKIVVNEVTYHRHASKFHIFFDTIVCHAGDIVKIYHNPERQFILHSDDEESDKAAKRIVRETGETDIIGLVHDMLSNIPT